MEQGGGGAIVGLMGFDEMLERIGNNYRIMRSENEQLKEELDRLRSFLSRRPKSRCQTPQPPPIPKLPASWCQDDRAIVVPAAASIVDSSAKAAVERNAKVVVVEQVAVAAAPAATQPQPPVSEPATIGAQPGSQVVATGAQPVVVAAPARIPGVGRPAVARPGLPGGGIYKPATLPIEGVEAAFPDPPVKAAGVPAPEALPEAAAVLPGMVQPQAWQSPRMAKTLNKAATFSSERKSSNRKKAVQKAAVENVPFKDRKSEERRLRTLFKIDEEEPFVTRNEIHAALLTRYVDDHISLSDVGDVIKELNQLAPLCPSEGAEHTPPEDAVCFEAMMDFLTVPDLLKSSLKTIDHCGMAEDVFAGLSIITVDEVVGEVTRGTKTNTAKPDPTNKTLFGRIINPVVMVTVLVSICTMGISVDYAPSAPIWLAIEAVCCSIYVIEAIFKIWTLGVREYFWGEAYVWNLVDFFITNISAFELSVTILAHVSPDEWSGSQEQASGAFQIAVLLRVLRIARVVRMAKLVRSPVLSDLANMLVGFIIGIPSLAWVMVLFVFILYMVGLVFRMSFGPLEGQNYISECGMPDDIVDLHSVDCPVHYLYGEEFFGTVEKSMFTSFRFMLGDYSTRGGKSIIVAFSAGYGKVFDTVYVAWMIVVIFGLFNIITAIFVDSTISGLKYNDIKRKYAKQYERKYVSGKLADLLERIQSLHMEYIYTQQQTRQSTRFGVSLQEPWMKVWDTQKIEVDIDEFVVIMSDDMVTELLQEIDIDMANPLGAFDTFDPNGDGVVSVSEMVAAIMRLRGDPEKKDIIAGWVAIKALHDKVDKLTKLVLVSNSSDEAPYSSEWDA